MELTIPRSKWLRGEDCLASMLLRPSDGKQCCVGIYLSALGIPDSALRDEDSAWSVRDAYGDTIHGDAKWLVDLTHYDETTALYWTNDDPSRGEPSREHRVAAIFAHHGVAVTFTD